MRPIPIALRTAYSCCRCSPRTSSSAAAFPQAINSTSAAAPSSGSRIRLPSRFISSVTGSSLRREPFETSSLSCASLAASTASSCCPCCGVTPSRSRATTFQYGSFRYFGSGYRRHPEIHRRVDVVIRLLRRSRRRQESHARFHHPDHCRRHLPPTDAHCLPDNLLIATKRPLPEFISQQNRPSPVLARNPNPRNCDLPLACSPIT